METISAPGLHFQGKSSLRLAMIRHLLLLSSFSVAVHAAAVLPPNTTGKQETAMENPMRPALEAFQAGRHASAVELAKPFAEQGNPEALYLMGFAHESGKGVERSQEKALEFYRMAVTGNSADALYRLSFILLASEKEDDRLEARIALESAAKGEPTVAGRILGEAYLRGRLSAAADAEKAVFWWQRAADAGDVPSILLLARFYEGQFGFPEKKNAALALASYGKAAGLGDPAAMAAFGSRLLSGEEKSRDEAKGREWLKKAIEAKEISAHLALGDFQEFTKKDLKAALAEYERGKDAGQLDCTLRAADFYLLGKGVEKDEARGRALLEKAAEGGSPVANFRVAVQTLSAEKPDIISGYKHLLAAANGNVPEAQNELGLFYLAGKLTGPDAPAGTAWLTRAAQGGFAPAQNNLATLYETGSAGLAQNIETAGQLYTLAANQNHPAATLSLARLVNSGSGTKADPAKALALATLAEERGEKSAAALIATLNAKLDDAQKAEAKKYLAEMKAPAAKPDEAPKKTK